MKQVILTLLHERRGCIVLFDSRTQHRVLKVTKGTRRSIVGWVLARGGSNGRTNERTAVIVSREAKYWNIMDS